MGIYDDIVSESGERHLTAFNDASLRRYFDACFQAVVEHFDLYPAWVCTTCLGNATRTVEWGESPATCTACGSDRVFEIATFQGRAPRYGAAFMTALMHVMDTVFELELLRTPGNTKTHDLEASPTVAVEAKGSARQLRFPSGETKRLPRAGLLRSDTEKKAFDNARKFKMTNPDSSFFIATNALPPRLVGQRGENVDGIFDVTKIARLEAFVREIRGAM